MVRAALIKIINAILDLVKTGDAYAVNHANTCLYFALCVGEDEKIAESTLNECCINVGGDVGRFVRDLVKKVIMKLKESELFNES